MFMLMREGEGGGGGGGGESGVALQILFLTSPNAEVFLLHRRTPKFRCSYSFILSYLAVRKMQEHPYI